MHGGSNLWGETKKADTRGLGGHPEPDVIVDPEVLKVTSQGSVSPLAEPWSCTDANEMIGGNNNPRLPLKEQIK